MNISEDVLAELAEKCGKAEIAPPDPSFGGKRRVLVDVGTLRALIGFAREHAQADAKAAEANRVMRAHAAKSDVDEKPTRSHK